MSSSLPPISDVTPLLDEAETWSIDQLREHQLQLLRQTLHRVYEHVPHYTAAFDAAGFHPNDLHELADLRHAPLTAKAELRDNYPFGLLAVPREDVVRVHASSGTTGRPTVVGYTKEDIATWAGLVARSLRSAGVRPGDVVHVAYGYGLFTGGLGAHYGAEALGCTVVPMSGGQSARQVQLIHDFGARVIMVTPSYFLSLLDEMDRQGLDPRESPLEIGVFGAEPWTPAMRTEIEERAGMHAVDLYGLSEVMGPGVAQEAVETKDGLTIWEDHFYPEIIDPITEQPVAEGEVGELVFTSLSKQAMPVIRYRTRDLTRLLPGTARPAMRRMEKITGRSDDLMIVRGVNVFPTQIEELVLQLPGLTPYFQCVLTRPDRLDELTVRVEADPNTSEDTRMRLAAELSGRIKERIGASAAVEIVDPDGIERSVGKARRILDQR
ncbi:phenylacetate--CoA ligase family protein [Luteipulveratus mongoliensis]|uniref:Phenylacetate-coenzyme A ligase n=1 Tax=Luteipulveratus mongoliensis TaxID=571913 RepID=A0A0K1JNT9_9MICO|nr:AMP-binding protein [Luteipulveratus mongoliensis]AKU18389.1 phenylacetate--CoA ligase [Luteipulveratus mongoliensis]